MKYLLFILFLTVILNPWLKENNLVELHEKSHQVPVLKNMKENPVLQFNLKLDNTADTFVAESVTIALDGTDNLNDIKTVRIWSLIGATRLSTCVK